MEERRSLSKAPPTKESGRKNPPCQVSTFSHSTLLCDKSFCHVLVILGQLRSEVYAVNSDATALTPLRPPRSTPRLAERISFLGPVRRALRGTQAPACLLLEGQLLRVVVSISATRDTSVFKRAAINNVPLAALITPITPTVIAPSAPAARTLPAAFSALAPQAIPLPYASTSDGPLNGADIKVPTLQVFFAISRGVVL